MGGRPITGSVAKNHRLLSRRETVHTGGEHALAQLPTTFYALRSIREGRLFIEELRRIINRLRRGEFTRNTMIGLGQLSGEILGNFRDGEQRNFQQIHRAILDAKKDLLLARTGYDGLRTAFLAKLEHL